MRDEDALSAVCRYERENYVADEYLISKVGGLTHDVASLTARLAEAEAERDVERSDRTAAEFDLLACRELLRELYEHEINKYGRWTAGMCQRVLAAAR